MLNKPMPPELLQPLPQKAENVVTAI